ncbi:uncharacterized protein [Choristoneura fumiferana]|uniref:uncharacterized protein n=1 Tax=Choristoneura fumiferana TaxID=7141 RepID=UPI003D1552EE
MELIDKRLEADLADLNDEIDENSPRSELDAVSNRSHVEKWVEHSQLEWKSQSANAQGEVQKEPGSLYPPAPKMDAGTDGPIQQLANVLKDLLTTTATERQNTNLLSRISTPKDLPIFTGDPMEWLQFKTAYEESTRMCQFSDTENLWRLRKCLRGPAKDAVSALLISATSPDILLSTLELQFGNSDIIISRIIYEIKKLSPMLPDYHKEIVIFSNKIKNYVAAVRALKREEYLQGMSIVTIVLSKLPTILLSKWADYSYPRIAQETTRLELLADFLHEEAVKISACSATLLHVRPDYFKRKYQDKNDTNVHSVLTQSGQSELKCRYCKVSKHDLTECKKFKKALRKDRWLHVKRFRLCYKCLLSQHDRHNCPAALCDVNNCGQAHHRLLHFVPTNQVAQNSTPVIEEPPETFTEANTEAEVVTHINSNSASAVLLKVVPINIHGPSGVIIKTTALLDDGSTVSLISAGLAARVGVRGRRECMRVRGAWDSNELVCDTQIIDISLSNRDGTMFTFTARSVKELDLPKQNTNLVNCDNFKHLQKLKSDLCDGQFKPEILIGQDNYHMILPLEVIFGGPNEPCATRTPLGWCVHGRAPACVPSSTHVLHTTLFDANHEDNTYIIENKRLLNDLHEEVRRNFAVDSIGISIKPRLNCEDERARELLEQTSTLVDGKWYVGLPWKEENSVMPDSFPHAMSRLKNVEQKMEKDAGYKQRYSERVQHLFENDYAQEVIDPQPTPRTWYLPHFGVDNPNKTKLRLVFDAAAKTNDLSLNHYLLKGPDLLVSLFGIMLRFRESRIAVTGDIKDMFLRVKIRAEDQNALRFLYRPEPDGPVKTFLMTSLIFGANCSPFIAQFIKNKNAQRFKSSFPSATHAICNQHYMDDWIDSLPDEETAIKLIHDVRKIHEQGNFEIRNFTSNSKTVINSLPKETLGPTAVRFKVGEQYDGERTLGLIWHPEQDTLSYDVSFKKIPANIINGQQRPSKRDMLRVVMSIFDVYGFLSPFTIIGKIIIQETWRLNLTWDEPIPDDVYSEWCKWTSLIKTLENVRLPRYYCDAAAAGRAGATHTPSQPVSRSQLLQRDAPALLSIPVSPNINICYTNLQLHIFCDSSLKAMCAVAYWRWDWNGLVNVAFIASKCRVTPNKNTSIPRLELQAAVLAARLADSIINAHTIKAERRIFWCDSSTTLHWIRNEARTYKPYVAHRLGEIDELTLIKEWRFVPTKLNAADIGTRKSYDRSILENEWLNGPTFLRSDESDWPADVINPETEENKLECICVIQNIKNNLPVPEPTRFSSWLRLLKATHAVFAFINKCKKLTEDANNVMGRAECLLLKCSQAQTFEDEINTLKNGKHLPRSSKLLTLSPYLDNYGVLRAQGRIDAAAEILPETKRPAILDGRDYITRLIVKFYHVNSGHENQETVVNNIKQKYWIIKLRPTVKTVTSQCMTCRIRKCKPEIPRMGDLPKARMAHHQRPFTFCGIDLFGPFEVTIGRRREKRYGVLFTCLTVRAIHLETVATLTSDSLIMAVRRMAARRGWPQHIYSDNGTNLRGADAELKRSVQELDKEILQNEVMNHGTNWTFIPAASPHWAGAWERLIRNVKSSLKIILKERAPKEETFNTLLAEVENIVNSRPLTHVSVDPKSQETLTPNHFLLGSSSNLPHIGSFDDSEFYLKRQWRIAQRLADLFWKRWVKEVLPDLIPRKKWHVEQRPLQVGDLVLVVDPNGPRNTWPRGKIEHVLPGRDGRIRMVHVRTKSGLLTRSAVRVARLPVGEECC